MQDFSNLPNVAPDFDLETLFEAGCHFGHQVKRWHPKMAEYIYTKKNKVHIFDLVKTIEQLKLAYNFLYQLGSQGKTVIFVGTKKQAREIIKAQCIDAGLMYIASRWMGGFLTNWQQIYKSIKRMNEIAAGLKGNKFEGYTKFERVQLEKEKSRLERFFEGVVGLKGKPDAIFIVDAGKENGTVIEAKQVGVTVVAMVDSDTDPSPLDLAIPVNDDSVKSVELVVKALAEAYKAGKSASKGVKKATSSTATSKPTTNQAKTTIKVESKKVDVKPTKVSTKKILK